MCRNSCAGWDKNFSWTNTRLLLVSQRRSETSGSEVVPGWAKTPAQGGTKTFPWRILNCSWFRREGQRPAGLKSSRNVQKLLRRVGQKLFLGAYSTASGFAEKVRDQRVWSRPGMCRNYCARWDKNFSLAYTQLLLVSQRRSETNGSEVLPHCKPGLLKGSFVWLMQLSSLHISLFKVIIRKYFTEG